MNTEAIKAIKSNMDNTVWVEAEGEVATLDIFKTREFPGVSSDKKSDKENLRDIYCPSNIRDIEVNESIQSTRKNP